MTEFNTVINKHIPKLDMYTLPLTRAHGKNHPEVFRVHELYQSINAKVKDIYGYNVFDAHCAKYCNTYKTNRSTTLNYNTAVKS